MQDEGQSIFAAPQLDTDVIGTLDHLGLPPSRLKAMWSITRPALGSKSLRVDQSDGHCVLAYSKGKMMMRTLSATTVAEGATWKPLYIPLLFLPPGDRQNRAAGGTTQLPRWGRRSTGGGAQSGAGTRC